jgi:hypothetical protein
MGLQGEETQEQTLEVPLSQISKRRSKEPVKEWPIRLIKS